MNESIPPRRPKYRLYVDEVGHASLKTGTTDAERYLSLIGVACHLDYVKDTIQPQMERLKRFFVREQQVEWNDPDERTSLKPVIFHRKEMVSCLYPFEALKELEVRRVFDSELLNCLKEWDYTVFSIVIDKDKLQEKYFYQAHPYHFAMETLLERYVRWLEQKQSLGDVMAEARGGKEDQLLKSHFQHLYQSGTKFVESGRMASRLSSRELKIKLKTENVTGLQLAEFLVRPCYYAALARKRKEALPANFGGQIETIVEESKYDRDADGVVEGYGRKWFP